MACNGSRAGKVSTVTTRPWHNATELRLIMKLSPALNEVNLGFHWARRW